MNSFIEIASYSFWAVLLAVCAAAFVLGIALLIKPHSLLRGGQRIKRWFAAQGPVSRLQAPIKIERYVYRRHRFFGALILSGALFTLYSLIYRYNEAATISAYAAYFNRTVVEWVAESATAFLAITGVCAALIGAVMLIRPSLLKSIEAWANRRYPSPVNGKLLNVMKNSERLATSYPRLTGFLLSLVSLVILTHLALL